MHDNAIPKRSPWVTLAIHYVALIGLFLLLIYVVPRCHRMLQDFDAEVPLITKWVFICSPGSVVQWWLMLPPVLAADTVVLVILARAQPTRTLPATVWSVSVLAAVTLMIVVIVVAVGLPMMELLRNLS